MAPDGGTQPPGRKPGAVTEEGRLALGGQTAASATCCITVTSSHSAPALVACILRPTLRPEARSPTSLSPHPVWTCGPSGRPR